MSTIFDIPYTAPPESFSVGIGDATYRFTTTWCDAAACWTVAIADEDGNPILSSLPIVTGADLLEQYAYLAFGFQLVAQTDYAPDLPPDFTNLGGAGHLYAILP